MRKQLQSAALFLLFSFLIWSCGHEPSTTNTHTQEISNEDNTQETTTNTTTNTEHPKSTEKSSPNTSTITQNRIEPPTNHQNQAQRKQPIPTSSTPQTPPTTIITDNNNLVTPAEETGKAIVTNPNSKELEKKQDYKVTLVPAKKIPHSHKAELELESYENGTFNFNVYGDFLRPSESKDQSLSKFIGLLIDQKTSLTLFETSYTMPLRDGGHRLFAYLGATNKEGLKQKKSFISTRFIVKNGTLIKKINMKLPEIQCVSPYGIYPSENIDKILLDFYVVNTQLGSNKVKLTINDGQSFLLKKVQAYYLKGLPYGENTIELMLVDGNGNKLNVPSNPIRRSFRLQHPDVQLTEEEMQEIIDNLDK